MLAILERSGLKRAAVIARVGIRHSNTGVEAGVARQRLQGSGPLDRIVPSPVRSTSMVVICL